MIKLEVCTGSYEDAIAAYNGGADRIELNSALHLGGLTPSIACLRMVKKAIDIPVCCMLRVRAAGFNYTEKEVEVMFAEAKDLLDNGADGIVFGFLDDNSLIDYSLTKRMVDLIHSYNAEAVVHRAFDCLKDPYSGIETLIELKVDRILTSGLKAKAIEGLELIKDLQTKYGDKIQILVGSGVNNNNVDEIVSKTGVTQVHSSCKSWNKDFTTHINPDVNFSYADDFKYEIVDIQKVKELKNTIEKINNA